MGGPCYLLVDAPPPADAAAAANAAAAAAGRLAAGVSSKPRQRVRGPRATDNFAVDPFTFDGARWQSVEQCYQAHKFLDPSKREAIRQILPHAVPQESDHSYGLRVWRMGASGTLRDDWDAVKVEIMLSVCRSKLAAHEALREQLLGTGDAPIVGGPSTEWHGASGHHGWSTWNGRINELLREELRQAASGGAPSEKLVQLQAVFADYMEAEGGAKHPLPGTTATLSEAE